MSLCVTGSHTIGNTRCTSFRQRLYNNTGNGQPDFALDQTYAAQLRANCPRTGGDENLFVMDPGSPTKFDNGYYNNLIALKGIHLCCSNQMSLAAAVSQNQTPAQRVSN